MARKGLYPQNKCFASSVRADLRRLEKPYLRHIRLHQPHYLHEDILRPVVQVAQLIM